MWRGSGRLCQVEKNTPWVYAMDKEHDHGRYDSGHPYFTGANSFKNSYKQSKIHEENGSIILTPVSGEKPRFDHLIGIFSDGKMSIDKFLLQKQLDKEKELEN
jgi:hypothetical protein